MQTAIHFEGDLAYICVSDQGEIKEEEPVTYGRSRVEFVISTAQAQKEGTIGVVLDEAAPQIVQQADPCRNHKRKGKIFYQRRSSVGSCWIPWR